MTKDERQQSLANARLACEWLKTWVIRTLFKPHDELMACLVAEFERLDAGEQKRNEAGRQSGHKGKKYGIRGAKHGKKGGRPRKAKEEE